MEFLASGIGEPEENKNHIPIEANNMRIICHIAEYAQERCTTDSVRCGRDRRRCFGAVVSTLYPHTL